MGFTQAFYIGADRKAVTFRASGHNLQSVQENPLLVEQHLQEELLSFHLLGATPPYLAMCHTSPIGLIPKPNQPGQWRLIADLSAPAEEALMMLSTQTCGSFAMLPWTMQR